MAKRMTHRSSKGTKLYAVRDKKGRFKDIQTYKRAHAADLSARPRTRNNRSTFARIVAARAFAGNGDGGPSVHNGSAASCRAAVAPPPRNEVIHVREHRRRSSTYEMAAPGH